MKKNIYLIYFFFIISTIQNVIGSYAVTTSSSNSFLSSSEEFSKKIIKFSRIKNYIKNNKLCHLYNILENCYFDKQFILEKACKYDNIYVIQLLMFKYEASPFIKNKYNTESLYYCNSYETEMRTIELVGLALQYNGALSNPHKYPKNHYLKNYIQKQCLCFICEICDSSENSSEACDSLSF